MMKLKRLFMALIVGIACCAAVPSLAQTQTLTGIVTDTAGNGLGGVSVLVKGTSIGTQTASDGTFSLNLSSSTARTLTISYIGYEQQEISVKSDKITVALKNINTSLADVVVVGYGTARKKDLTGAVTTVTAKDFQKGNITTPDQLITGKVPGVSITSNGGRPGAGSTIRVRGGSSLSASNDPLIVIDGVPLDNDGVNGAANPLSFINANDIESFTVLKDASAAAIYGTRAANGVIIITTKKGKSGSLKVNFSSVNSLSEITKTVDVLSPDQVRDVINLSGTAAQKAQLGTANTNWQDVIFQNAFSTDNNISISGGLKRLPYRVSIGYQYQNGILKTDHLQKVSGALVINPTFFDNHLKVDINLKGSTQDTRFGNQGAIPTAIGFDPTQPVYTSNKRYGSYFEWLESDGSLVLNAARNPLGLLEQTFDQQKPMRSIGNIQLDYKFHFLPDLHANVNLAYDISKSTGTYFVPDSAAASYLAGGQRNPSKQTKKSSVFDFYLNYTKDIKSIHSHIDATAGYSYNDYQTKNYNYRGFTANGDTIAGTKAPDFLFNIPRHTLLSYFGRLNYSFYDKYLLTATIRRDGSSRFGPNNKWGTFPSVALGWRIKQENFLKNSNALSDLKLRLGYGVTGQQDGIGNYDYLSYYYKSTANASYYFGAIPTQSYSPGGFNANLKWEQTATYNAAIDYGFAKNRINGSIDFYLKKTSDLLNYIAQPAGANFSAFITSNVGSMENKGVEFNINANLINHKDFSWDVNFNATYNKNTIKNLTVVPNDPNYIGLLSNNGATPSGVNGFLFINAVGDSKNTFYLYKQVYDSLGNPIEGLFEDRNRDGVINDLDKYKSKRGDPNIFLGFSTNVNYKKWNAGVVLRSNLNNYVYNNIWSNLGKLTSIAGTYTTGNGSTNYLSTGFKGGTDIGGLSDYYIQNASFLRMDNLSVGYNFGSLKRYKANLRLSATVQNVFVISKYKGLDPEIPSGVDNNLYPRPRIYALGVNLDF